MTLTTIAVCYKELFDSMCGLDDHNFKRTKHQLLTSTVSMRIKAIGVTEYKFKDDSQLRLQSLGELKAEVIE